jgi:uroporphyrinogen decarboxylase
MTEKPLLEVLRHGQAKRRPVWFMRQAGRYLPEYRAVRERAGSFLELCYAPELAAEVTLQPLRRFDVDAAILFADILLIPQKMGLRLDFVQSEGPQLETVASAEDVARLDAAGAAGRLGPVYETVGRVREGLAAGVALIGFCGAPWTVASYMIEGGSSPDRSLARRAAYEASWFGALIGKLVEASTGYLVEQVRAGVEVVQIFDSWAGDLSPDLRRRWCDEPIRQMVAGLRRAGCDVPVIGFARGIGAAQMEFAAHTGVDAVGLESSMPAAWAVRELEPRVAIQGNIDPLAVVVGGQSLEREVAALLAAVPAERHIVNLGHGLRPETPPQHVGDLVAAIRRHEAATGGDV